MCALHVLRVGSRCVHSSSSMTTTSIMWPYRDQRTAAERVVVCRGSVVILGFENLASFGNIATEGLWWSAMTLSWVR